MRFLRLRESIYKVAAAVAVVAGLRSVVPRPVDGPPVELLLAAARLAELPLAR